MIKASASHPPFQAKQKEMGIFKLMLVIYSNIIIYKNLIPAVAGERSLAPALYIFGDSSIDVGNNNHLNTSAKMSKFPSGMSLNNRTGRFTDGKTIADFIAIMLGLPMAPAYLDLNDSVRRQTTTGINYASAGSGILKETGPAGCLTLDKQIEYFRLTVEKDLPHAIETQEGLRGYLANSIYILFTGGNDFNVAISPILRLYGINNRKAFARRVFSIYAARIKTLYDLGARKFLVQDVLKDFELQKMLEELKPQVPFSIFTFHNPTNISNQVRSNPKSFGFTHVDHPCFDDRTRTVCSTPKRYIMWDSYGHYTEAANEIGAKDCFNGSSNTCAPFNILELAAQKVEPSHRMLSL